MSLIVPRAAARVLKHILPDRIVKLAKDLDRGPSRIVGSIAIALNAPESLVQRIARLRLVIYNMLRPRTVMFFPDVPGSGYLLHKMCLRNGYRIVGRNSSNYHIAVLWQDLTRIDSSVIEQVRRRDVPIVNGGCLDISKSRLSELHEEVFGYTLEVDPAMWGGTLIEKPDDNCAGPVRILRGPLASRTMGQVYQRVIGEIAEDGSRIELRISVVAGEVVMVRRRGRSEHDGDLRGRVTFSENCHWSQVLDPTEHEKIIELAQRMGLDVGEIDAMRDVDNGGRLYVIDVNRTPTGLRVTDPGLSPEDRYAILDAMSSAFHMAYF